MYNAEVGIFHPLTDTEHLTFIIPQRMLRLLGILRKYFHMYKSGDLFCSEVSRDIALHLIRILDCGYLPPICSIDVLDIENKKKRKEQCQ